MGFKTILVLSGIADEEELIKYGYGPNLVVEAVDKIEFPLTWWDSGRTYPKRAWSSVSYVFPWALSVDQNGQFAVHPFQLSHWTLKMAYQTNYHLKRFLN